LRGLLLESEGLRVVWFTLGFCGIALVFGSFGFVLKGC
jgi:hypothetical protein